MNFSTDTTAPATAAQFIETIFPPELMAPDERVVIAHPDSFTRDGELIEYYRQINFDRRALRSCKPWYFCVSTVELQHRRQVKKSMREVRTAFVLVIDDVGTKSKPPGVEPSYKLKTSRGNYQYGYLLEPYDVSTPEGQGYYDACLFSLAQAGHNDPGFRSATRLARLPGSLHKSGFRAELVEMEPLRSWELPHLMREFDIPLERPRVAQALKPGKHSKLEDVEDPILSWLLQSGRLKGYNDQWVYMHCPWRERHTGGAQGATSTAYSPRDYGTEGEAFKCLHGHCASRDLAEFKRWVLAQMRPQNNYLTGGE